VCKYDTFTIFRQKNLRNAQYESRLFRTVDTSRIAAPRGGRRSYKPQSKPVSYVNYSSDTSSQFSADVIEIENGPDIMVEEATVVIQEDAV